ncbi:phage tail protein [Mangrovicoccus ximenensis]|uniref:hypothetical protein n=1 Tax=Mangrovicoccus ximenensis TaxID=1911570 RepID=UPI000D38D48D|nr:hypothetical protein [Mangrovicoccus ximenensis]
MGGKVGKAITAAVTVAAIAFTGGAATIALGATLSWGTVLAGAAVQGAIAGIGALTAKTPKGAKPAKTGSEITLNSLQAVSEGIMVYGERMVGGPIVARSTSRANGSDNGRYHSIIVLACHEIDSVREIYVGDRLVWTLEQWEADEADGTKDELDRGLIGSRYRTSIGIAIRLGTPGQQAVGQYYARTGDWTTKSRGRGIAYLYFTYEYGKHFRQGTPTVRARIRGKKVHDWRSGQTAWSANPALIARDYAVTAERFGGIGWTDADLDMAALTALANIADEQVAQEAGGTQNRYEYNGILDTAVAPSENLDRLATAWGGWWTHDRGLLSVGGAGYEAPSFAVDPDMMVGTIDTQAKRQFEDQANVIKGVFAPADAEFVLTDLPVMSSAAFRAEDAGQELVQDIGELPGETDIERGQRLQKLVLLKGRRQKSAVVPCNLEAVGVGLGDTVTLDAPWRGWAAKPFEVVGREISVGPGEGGEVRASVILSLIETDAAVYDETTSEETGSLISVASNFPSRLDEPVVTPPQVAEGLYDGRTGGARLYVDLSSTSDNPFIRYWQFAWHLASDGPENAKYSQNSEEPGVRIPDFTPGVWIFGARAITEGGIVGDWSWAAAAQVQGLSATPSAISGLHMQPSSQVAILKWLQHPDIDVIQGGRIEFRHSNLQSGATWSNSRSIGIAVPGTATETSLPLLPGTYLARAYDSTGIAGPVAAVSTRAPSLLGQSAVASIAEATAFTGAKSGCEISGGTLVLSEGETAAEYLYAGQIDLGSVQDVRLVTEVGMTAAGRDDLFWTGDAGFWTGDGEFWATELASGDIQVLVSETDDDPSGAPAWSAYTRIHASDMNARAFRFKAQMTTATADDEVTASILSVTAYQ